jgi:hypothetical protein
MTEKRTLGRRIAGGYGSWPSATSTQSSAPALNRLTSWNAPSRARSTRLLVAAYHVRGAGWVERRGTAFGIVYEAT